MQNRFVRLGVVLVLLASAAAATDIFRGRLTDGTGASADLDRRIDRLLELTGALRSAQAGYVAPGQDPTAPLATFENLLHDVTALTSETSALLRSREAASALGAFADATSRLTEVDAAAREQLLIGDTLTASHLLFADAARAADAMASSVARLRDAERLARGAAAEATARQNNTMLASVAGLWMLGLLLLAFVPIRQSVRKAARDGADGEPGPQRSVAIGSAADLCTEISRVETATALSALLTRAVSLLEAEGAIIWMESGGELLAAAAAGYAPEVAARLSTIHRHDDNMTATAWREGVTEVVQGGEQSGAAIAVPLFSGPRCCGVFALELRAGRQPDDLTRDLARMIAAQLATVVVGPSNAVSPSAATGS